MILIFKLFFFVQTSGSEMIKDGKSSFVNRFFADAE